MKCDEDLIPWREAAYYLCTQDRNCQHLLDRKKIGTQIRLHYLLFIANLGYRQVHNVSIFKYGPMEACWECWNLVPAFPALYYELNLFPLDERDNKIHYLSPRIRYFLDWAIRKADVISTQNLYLNYKEMVRNYRTREDIDMKTFDLQMLLEQEG
jgi:hypothetical protein